MSGKSLNKERFGGYRNTIASTFHLKGDAKKLAATCAGAVKISTA